MFYSKLGISYFVENLFALESFSIFGVCRRFEFYNKACPTKFVPQADECSATWLQTFIKNSLEKLNAYKSITDMNQIKIFTMYAQLFKHVHIFCTF